MENCKFHYGHAQKKEERNLYKITKQTVYHIVHHTHSILNEKIIISRNAHRRGFYGYLYSEHQFNRSYLSMKELKS